MASWPLRSASRAAASMSKSAAPPTPPSSGVSEN
eukprot:CAMPEP_0182548888 /NCGR_PEP_ID=MMETSP1323-20130603/39449_1 /TAXON_ID=236787 /ORGANISM="Florenciella parvula, Strain RCC1693" /LENGTH=33 /DNA_ID= /DNA_START= /DNA_END= /DNA_ORIENTATION=